MSRRHLFALSLIVCFIASCSSTAEKTDQAAVLPAEGAYEATLAKNTRKDSVFNGLYNLFQYNATLLTVPMIEAQIERAASYNQWSESQTREMREKTLQEHSGKTQVFISFFAPDRANSKVLGKEGVWTVYLESRGQRYPGELRKVSMNKPEIQNLYPYSDRWSTPYIAVFPVPVSGIQANESKFTITSPVGASTVIFAAAE